MLREIINELRSPMMWGELGAIVSFTTVALIIFG